MSEGRLQVRGSLDGPCGVDSIGAGSGWCCGSSSSSGSAAPRQQQWRSRALRHRLTMSKDRQLWAHPCLTLSERWQFSAHPPLPHPEQTPAVLRPSTPASP